MNQSSQREYLQTVLPTVDFKECQQELTDSHGKAAAMSKAISKIVTSTKHKNKERFQSQLKQLQQPSSIFYLARVWCSCMQGDCTREPFLFVMMNPKFLTLFPRAINADVDNMKMEQQVEYKKLSLEQQKVFSMWHSYNVEEANVHRSHLRITAKKSVSVSSVPSSRKIKEKVQNVKANLDQEKLKERHGIKRKKPSENDEGPLSSDGRDREPFPSTSVSPKKPHIAQSDLDEHANQLSDSAAVAQFHLDTDVSVGLKKTRMSKQMQSGIPVSSSMQSLQIGSKKCEKAHLSKGSHRQPVLPTPKSPFPLAISHTTTPAPEIPRSVRLVHVSESFIDLCERMAWVQIKNIVQVGRSDMRDWHEVKIIFQDGRSRLDSLESMIMNYLQGFQSVLAMFDVEPSVLSAPWIQVFISVFRWSSNHGRFILERASGLLLTLMDQVSSTALSFINQGGLEVLLQTMSNQNDSSCVVSLFHVLTSMAKIQEEVVQSHISSSSAVSILLQCLMNHSGHQEGVAAASEALAHVLWNNPINKDRFCENREGISIVLRVIVDQVERRRPVPLSLIKCIYVDSKNSQKVDALYINLLCNILQANCSDPVAVTELCRALKVCSLSNSINFTTLKDFVQSLVQKFVSTIHTASSKSNLLQSIFILSSLEPSRQRNWVPKVLTVLLPYIEQQESCSSNTMMEICPVLFQLVKATPELEDIICNRVMAVVVRFINENPESQCAIEVKAQLAELAQDLLLSTSVSMDHSLETEPTADDLVTTTLSQPSANANAAAVPAAAVLSADPEVIVSPIPAPPTGALL